jgi:hypothetical protein
MKGYAPPSARKTRGLGDLVHQIALPVAKAIDAVAGTNLQTCGGCKRRREKLNQIKLP